MASQHQAFEERTPVADTMTRRPVQRTPGARRRTAWLVGAVAAVVAVAVTAVVLSRGDDGPAYPVVQLAPTDHEVIYEVTGAGTAPVVTYIVGEDNKEKSVLNVQLPFRQTVTIPVGPAGGHANIEVRNPGTGAGSLACTMFLDGVQVAQQVSTDGFAGVACSVLIPPTYVK